MIHVIYISVIILIYMMFAFLYRAQKLDLEKITKEKDAIIKEKEEQYDSFNSDVWANARTWEQTTIKFNAVVKERDEVIKKIEQRNLYLENIVKEMVLEPK